jgi:two-component sensor histidine kinase
MSQDGTARYLGYVPVTAPPSGLYVSVGISKDEAFAEMNRGTLRAVLIAGVAVMAAGVLTYGLSRGLVRGPIERINQTIAARREGDLNVRTGLAAGRGEIEDLGRAVDTYMDELNEARAAQDVADKHRVLLTQEMAHRLKNVLAAVQAVAQQTFKQGRASGELKVFAARLQSIGAAQQLLVDDIGHIDLEAVIRTAVAPFDDGNGRIIISGPRIKIQSRANVAIALAFHELSTNAVKYGSLAYGDGNVDIHWTVVANG